MKFINKDAVLVEIEKLDELNIFLTPTDKYNEDYKCGYEDALEEVRDSIDTLEVKEVDMKKLGEIARHIIAVKENIEDMRLYKEEWFMLEKIGYPERFKAQKGEQYGTIY